MHKTFDQNLILQLKKLITSMLQEKKWYVE